MKIWAVTYGDGFEFSGVIIEAWDNEADAHRRALELQARLGKNSYAGYDVEEFTLNEYAKDLQ